MFVIDESNYLVDDLVFELYLDRGDTDESIRMCIEDWGISLDIAIEYGWKPRGTIHHEIDDWKGSYLCARGQKITREDAIELAEALLRGVIDNFQRLVGTKLSFVLELKSGLMDFAKWLIPYLRQGEFIIV